MPFDASRAVYRMNFTPAFFRAVRIVSAVEVGVCAASVEESTMKSVAEGIVKEWLFILAEVLSLICQCSGILRL